MSGEEWSRY
uniref:Uncharacterized protein n=1 Tax=Anguilla anguilla TaxID=7936 RepID=A0A0E9T2E0_ANGAN